MTPVQQRIAIAKACGLEYQHDNDCNVYFTIWGVRVLVDPLSDLNAMHEAEKVLKSKKLFFKYHLALASLPSLGGNNHLNTFHTTAAQRAEAFLRTLSLWTDTVPNKNTNEKHTTE